jgi:serine/threonine-protein kinase
LQYGNVVAIKFLAAGFAGRPELEARLLNEAKSLARLQHPNLVSVTDFLQVEGCGFLVMQLIDGLDLGQTIAKKGGPLDLDQVHEVSWDVLSALDYIHANGVVHRDVKPANILIDNCGTARLTVESWIRRTDLSLGTPDYMSPEQILRPNTVDSRADIYSLGCVVYEMLTGRLPFGVESSIELDVKNCHLRNAPPPLRDSNPNLSPHLEAVFLKCLEKDPAKRFQTCREVMWALDG